jgi:cyclase
MTTGTTAEKPLLEPLCRGVYAYLQAPGGWCVNNAGIISDDGVTVLIDTVATERRAKLLRQAVVSVAGLPSMVVNTHHHGDHVFGNAVFTPPATVVGHEGTRAETIESGFGLKQLWPGVDWGDLPLRPATLTFKDTLTLHVGGLTVELIHVGPAHTANDTVAWLPDEGVLFAGDVVMSGATPFCLMGSVEASIGAVERLRRLGPRVVVPGHGPVAGPEIFHQNEAYLHWVLGLSREGFARGRTPAEITARAELGEFAGLLDSERLAGNVFRACHELAGAPPGAPIDILTGFTEMISFHGGLPLCHA